MLNDICDIYCYDEEKVNRIRGEVNKQNVNKVAQLFKALADKIERKLFMHFVKMRSYVYVMLRIL